MGNHPFNVIVVLFWLATMSWLVVAKIVPPMRVGEPPSYRSILDESVRQPPVCWNIRLEDKSIGWAANKIERRDDGITELHSRVYLRNLPLEEFAPGWLGTVLKPVLRDLGPLNIDKTSRMTVDPLGRLVGFESRVRIADIPDAIKVHGQVEGSSLKLSIQSGEIPYKLERYLAAQRPDVRRAVAADDAARPARRPDLDGAAVQPVSSAEQPDRDFAGQGRARRSDHLGRPAGPLPRSIVYRSDPSSGLVSDEARGRMWVRDDGVVLRQEVTILRSRLQFLRLADERARSILSTLGDDWTTRLSDSVAGRLLNEADGLAH